MKYVRIYTDGACRGNPGPGGWGALLVYQEHEKVISGSEPETTNNRMELLATINALQALRQRCQVDLFTDSQYVRQGILNWIHRWKKNNWRTTGKKAVKNQDLWQELDRQTERHAVKWHWVKGHAGNPGNERADRLASQAIDKRSQ